MSVNLWSVNYLPTLIHLGYFEEMLISLSHEILKPEKYVFYISGKFCNDAEILVKHILFKVNYLIILNKKKTAQYIGMKKILLIEAKNNYPDYIIFMDGDDLVSHNRTKKMLKTIKKYKNKAIITVASKFQNIDSSDYFETISEIIPLAIENNYIYNNDKMSYNINQIFVSGEDTPTMILPYNIISTYLLNSKNLNDNYADVKFYEYLVENKLILFVPFKKPVYFYRIWDRPLGNKVSLHH